MSKHEKVNTNLPVNDMPPKPPLLIESTLHLAWGLTLYLSTSDKQSNLASQINGILLASFKNDNLCDTDKRYVNNLAAIISSYLRRMGFEKDIYDRYLGTEKDWLQRKIDYWKNMGDMTNFSGESTIVKIASFFGIGTAGNTIKDLLPSNKDSTVVNNATQSIHNAVQTIPNATVKAGGFSSESVYAIIIFGTIGLFAMIAFLKWFGNYNVTRATEKTNRNQDDYWQKMMRGRYQEELEILYHDIVYLVKYYYPKYTDDPLINHEHSVTTGHHKSLKDVIDEILPTKQDMYSRPKNQENL